MDVKKAITITIIVSMFLTSGMILAQEIEEPCEKAIQSAEFDTNRWFWIGGSCLAGMILLGFIPVLIGYTYGPNPEVTNLLGKSEEYVEMYISCYKKRRRVIQGNSAIVGCLIGTTAMIFIGFLGVVSLGG
jgi:hypothetical protein